MSESKLPAWAHVVAPDVIGIKTLIVNAYFVGSPGYGNSWALVDAGLKSSTAAIKAAAAELYGHDNSARSIVLTHGHFDHVGATEQLVKEWNVPVYAHEQELPYLTGRSIYPPPDPTVDPGLFARLSPLFPRASLDLSGHVYALPGDGSVPGLPGWRWLHTPGHTPGHVSFFRDEDKVLLAGDAFVTTKQESAQALFPLAPHVQRPPAYYTINWIQARHSVEELAALHPSAVGTGHGLPMHGEEMDAQLQHLAAEFPVEAIPKHGYYAQHPAEADASGIVRTPLPPDQKNKLLGQIGVVAAGAVMAVLLNKRRNTAA